MNGLFFAASNICDEQPCKHGGKCISSGTSFTCDCEGTGYIGHSCEIGVVSVSPIPNLMPGRPFTVTVTAYPDELLSVRVSIPPRQVKQLVFSSREVTKSFIFRPNQVGYNLITYTLYGPDSSKFADIPDSSFFVQRGVPGSFNEYFMYTNTPVGQLVEGCCVENALKSNIGRCGTSLLELTSSCRWESPGGGLYESPGVIFVTNDGFSLPFSVNGASVQGSAITLPTQMAKCQDCSMTRSAVQPLQHCYHYDFKSNDIRNFLTVRALALTYINTVQLMLPHWVSNLTIDLNRASDDVSVFAPYDYRTDLLTPEAMLSLRGCEGLGISDLSSGIYSILRYGRTITATVDDQTLSYPDPLSVDVPMCFAVNLCQGLASPLHIGLSPATESVVVSELLGEFVNSGWTISVSSVVLRNGSQSHQHSTSEKYWNGFTMLDLSPPGMFDLSMKLQVAAPYQSGTLDALLDFSGELHSNYQVHLLT